MMRIVGHYFIATRRTPDPRPLECHTLVPITVETETGNSIGRCREKVENRQIKKYERKRKKNQGA